uniref:SSD domain-containing protein n=1 Tax=Octactis speculum TaxID=3111310 RepID=A0A7S2GLB7_9STRA|mmetsp:Transcript_5227/g.6416  ORF Transcript_5227/g.6416 Transcript_5227/m.6416 type:complete len:510 (+) Transcript_5227:142-1671(+)
MKAKFRDVKVVSITGILALLAYGIFNIPHAMSLAPPEAPEEWFPKDHMFTKVRALSEVFMFAPEASYITVTVTFGISGINRKKANFNKFVPNSNRGDAIFDEGFDLSNPMCQKAFVRACNDANAYSCNADGCKPFNTIARTNSSICFMEEFRSWAENDTYTWDSSLFTEKLIEFRNTESPQSGTSENWEDLVGVIDGEIQYASFTFKAPIGNLESLETKRPVLERLYRFIDYVKDYPECTTASNPCDCGSVMQTTSFAWTWLRTEEGLVYGFYQGLLICFPVSFIVLLWSTGNYVVSIFALVSVIFIVVGVLGFIASVMGWDLGVSESVAGIIIIGFSVDYTVHLGHMYIHAEQEGYHDKEERFDYAARTMVSTVIAGAITTAVSGAFMFSCQMTFFLKMATLIVATIIFSYLYSLVFFMGLLYTIGPSGQTGKIPFEKLKFWKTQAAPKKIPDVVHKSESGNSVHGLHTDEVDDVRAQESDALRTLPEEPSHHQIVGVGESEDQNKLQ